MAENRILIIAHGHPDFNKGGAEIAAYNLYKEFSKRHDHEVVFMARAGGKGHESTPFGMRNEREILFFSNLGDRFIFSQENRGVIWNEFRSFLEKFKPTVVHFHHYMHLGLEILREVKNYSKETKVVLTLHEYLAICHNNGQMIKTNKELCYESSPIDCHQCFANIASSDFFLRKTYIQSFFEIVDEFVSPSNFLIDRYAKWGLDTSKIKMIENGQPETKKFKPRKVEKGQTRARLGFFGQINPYKGVDVLLEAIKLLPDEIRSSIHLDLHGANLDYQAAEFKEKINDLLDELNDCVTYHGKYEQDEMDDLVEEIDWVVIPSIWWENSPMVIQEAFNRNRPIICSDIGGMAEKVKDGVNGLHFRNKKPRDLARIMTKVVKEEDLYSKLVKNIKPPLSIEECADKHLALYVN